MLLSTSTAASHNAWSLVADVEQRFSGQQLSQLHPWTTELWQRDEGLQGEGGSASLLNKQVAGGSFCCSMDVADMWKLPMDLFCGNVKEASQHNIGANKPLALLAVCLSIWEVLEHFRDVQKPLLTFRKG